jgi:hypothetical protein
MGKVTHACTRVMLVQLQKKCSTEASVEQDQGIFCQAIEMRTASAVFCCYWPRARKTTASDVFLMGVRFLTVTKTA